MPFSLQLNIRGVKVDIAFAVWNVKIDVSIDIGFFPLVLRDANLAIKYAPEAKAPAAVAGEEDQQLLAQEAQ